MHVRCPHCQNPIEFVDDDESFEFDCPSCGSSFNLASDVETIGPDGSSSRSSDKGGGTTHTLSHFELIEKVGVGTFGAVYRARDIELDRLVAVKIPRQSHVDGSRAEMFLREARAVAQLKHPNIVSVHEVGRVGETLFIVSDFVEGLSLSQRLVEMRPPMKEAAMLCVTVAEALEHAHHQGVIHRDLKPSNIMLDEKNEPHIMDFGLAKREIGEITMTMDGKVLGTPAYMPPEQAKGEGHAADARSDVYSLGVILYELLTGELPFRGTASMLLHQMVHDEPPSPRKLNNTIPRDLETITLKCLEKEPERRYQTAQSLAADLSHWLNGEPVTARPVRRHERAWRWCCRKPLVASLAAAVVLLLLVLGIAGPWVAVHQSVLLAEAEAEKVIARHNLYVAHMNLAQPAWQDANIGRLRDLLGLYEGTGSTGFEWHFWNSLCKSELVKLSDHGSSVECIAWSPEGTHIAFGSLDGSIRLWRPMRDTSLVTLTGHSGDVQGLAFSPDGNQLASAGADQSIRLWDVRAGRERLALKGHTAGVQCVAFSPGGDWLVSGGDDRTIRTWATDDGRPLTTIGQFRSQVQAIAVSPDGRRIAAAGGGLDLRSKSGAGLSFLGTWDVATGRELMSFRGHRDSVFCATFSPGGDLLVSGGKDRSIRVWDSRSGRRVALLEGHEGSVTSLSISPNGLFLASGSADQTARVWEIATGKTLNTLKGHVADVHGVAFGPDGQRLTTGGADQTVRLWDVTTGRTFLAMQEPPTRSPPPGHVVNQGNIGATVVGLPTLESRGNSAPAAGNVGVSDSSIPVSRRYPDSRDRYLGTNSSVAFSLDGKRLVSRRFPSTILTAWDPATGRRTQQFLGHDTAILCLTVSHDGQLLASGSFAFVTETDSHGGEIRIWSVSTGKQLSVLKEDDVSVLDLAFSPDGRRLAAAGDDKTVTVWDLSTEKKLVTLTGPGKHVRCVNFSPDGRRLVGGSADEKLWIWETRNWRKLRTLVGHSGAVNCVVFSPDGLQLASAGMDSKVQLWDSVSGRTVLTIQGHVNSVWNIAFSPSGNRIASASNRSVKVWDLVTGEEVLDLSEPGGIGSLAFSSDGRRLATSGGERTLLWPAQTVEDR